MRYYQRLAAAWNVARHRHPQAWLVLAGDANLPELFREDEEGKRIFDPRGKIAQFFNNVFLSSLALSNSDGGIILPTHHRRGALDLVMIDPGLQSKPLKVLKTGIAGSDHSFVFKAAWGGEKHWSPNPSTDWDKVLVHIQKPLSAWHAWLNAEFARA